MLVVCESSIAPMWCQRKSSVKRRQLVGSLVFSIADNSSDSVRGCPTQFNAGILHGFELFCRICVGTQTCIAQRNIFGGNSNVVLRFLFLKNSYFCEYVSNGERFAVTKVFGRRNSPWRWYFWYIEWATVAVSARDVCGDKIQR